MSNTPMQVLAMSVPDNPSQNHLLAALPATEFGRLAPHLERVPLLLGETLYEPGEQLRHVFFPTTAIVSLLYVLESGASAEIAIVGMTGRFPGAANIAEFWRNLVEGVESISFFSTEELLAEGASADLIGDPGYVAARGVVRDAEWFDASFFGFAPRQAEVMDPQHRLLLEVSWEALENAGQVADRLVGSQTGVFAGLSTNDYWWLQIPDLASFDGHSATGGGI